MADEELIEGGDENKDPESEADLQADSDQERHQASDAPEAGSEEQDPDSGNVALDQDDSEEADLKDQESKGSSEDESIDDLVEQQMLAELEKLESEGADVSEAGKLSSTGHDSDEERDVQRPEFPTFGQTTSTSEQKNLDLLLDVNLPISIELGRTSMKIKEILSLGPGSVVELKKLAGEPVDLLVNNKIVARGEVVVVDENFGLRITSLLSREERLRSLE